MKETIRGCSVNFFAAIVAIYLAHWLTLAIVGEKMLAVGLQIGAVMVIILVKGLALEKHRFSMNLIAEIFLILGLSIGSFWALGMDSLATRVAYYEFLALVITFFVGFAVNRLSTYLSKRKVGFSVSDW